MIVNALSLMETMPAGLNPDFNDWRYTMITPDGTLIGTTGSSGSDNVAFCAGCQAAVDSQDNGYFVPPKNRVFEGWQNR